MKKQRMARNLTDAWPAQVSKEYYEYCLKQMPSGAIKADLARHAPHNSYSPPMWYMDEHCTCIDCGREFYFTARQQKRWYEQFKIPIQVRAVRCIRCRGRMRHAKASQKKRMAETATKPPHPNKLRLQKVRAKSRGNDGRRQHS